MSPFLFSENFFTKVSVKLFKRFYLKHFIISILQVVLFKGDQSDCYDMQSKWLINSQQRDINPNLKVRPGAFSNHSLNPKYYQDLHSKSITSQSISDYRQLQGKNQSNASFDIAVKTPTYITSENEVYTLGVEDYSPPPQFDQHGPGNNTSSRPLVERNGNQILPRDTKNQPTAYSMRHGNSEKQIKGSENYTLAPQRQGSQSKINHATQSAGRNSNSKSPGGYSNRKGGPGQAPGSATSSKRPTRQTENDENSNDMPPTKVTRSHSTMTLRPPSDSKSNNNLQQASISDGFVPQEQESSGIQKLKKENQDLWNNVNKLNTELQNEKKKSALLEGEVENFKNDLVKEREKYKDELFKISQQIKKLRNIQNIYVTEKKNSERLENQLNIKEKALSDNSYLLW